MADVSLQKQIDALKAEEDALIKKIADIEAEKASLQERRWELQEAQDAQLKKLKPADEERLRRYLYLLGALITQKEVSHCLLTLEDGEPTQEAALYDTSLSVEIRDEWEGYPMVAYKATIRTNVPQVEMIVRESFIQHVGYAHENMAADAPRAQVLEANRNKRHWSTYWDDYDKILFVGKSF